MPRLTIAEELDVAIKLAAKDAGRLSSRQVAEEFYGSERKLIDGFGKEWIIEKLASLIGRRRANDRREQDLQYSLVGFKPPRKFALKDGKQAEWGDATLNMLKQGRSVIWQEHKDYRHPAVRRFDAAIAFMEKYSDNQHRFTWAEVIELESKKVGSK